MRSRILYGPRTKVSWWPSPSSLAWYAVRCPLSTSQLAKSLTLAGSRATNSQRWLRERIVAAGRSRLRVSRAQNSVTVMGGASSVAAGGDDGAVVAAAALVRQGDEVLGQPGGGRRR